MMARRFSRESGFNTTTLARESNGALTSKDGFSVVAPTRITVPASTWGKSASCWDLLKRWISSMKSSVLCPRMSRRWAASATASRTSFTPAITAESATKLALVSAASRRPSVVLPVPGGPHRMSEVSSLPSSARRSQRPGPSRWSWPTNSASEVGRMRSASGCPRRSLPAACEKRSTAHISYSERGPRPARRPSHNARSSRSAIAACPGFAGTSWPHPATCGPARRPGRSGCLR